MTLADIEIVERTEAGQGVTTWRFLRDCVPGVRGNCLLGRDGRAGDEPARPKSSEAF